MCRENPVLLLDFFPNFLSIFSPPGGHPDSDAVGPEGPQHSAGGQVRRPQRRLLVQLPERLLLPAVAGLGVRRGVPQALPDCPHQDQAAAQAPSPETAIKIYLRPVRR